MDDAIRKALEIGPGSTREDKLVDITTYGARTGEPRRIEIVFHRLDGRWYLTGTPGPRGWYANLRKNPRLVFHLKHSVVADVPANARPITEDQERRQVLTPIVADIEATRGGELDLDGWLARSPLVELTFDDPVAIVNLAMLFVSRRTPNADSARKKIGLWRRAWGFQIIRFGVLLMEAAHRVCPGTKRERSVEPSPPVSALACM